MKKLATIVVLLIIVVASYFLFFKKEEAEVVEPEMLEINPEYGSVTQMVTASGRVTTNLDVEIKCKASGEIINLPYDVSDEVHEGDLLLELDPEDEERNVELARVNLREAQARLTTAYGNVEVAELNLETSYDLAEADLETTEAQADNTEANTARIQELYDQGFISQEEYDLAMTEQVVSDIQVESAGARFENLEADEISLGLLQQNVILAQASLESSRISLDDALQRLDETRVYAPMDGIVTERLVQNGQIISSGISSTSGGTTIMIISDLSRLFVIADVDESFIGQVDVGNEVQISADAYPTENFSGTVDRISPIGQNVSNVVIFEVRIEITSPNKDLLMPEMTADVEIITGRAENALLIPASAIRRTPQGSFVTVAVPGGEPEQRMLETGITDGEKIEILSGLSETDVILMNGSSGAGMWTNSGEERRGPPPGMMIR